VADLRGWAEWESASLFPNRGVGGSSRTSLTVRGRYASAFVPRRLISLPLLKILDPPLWVMSNNETHCRYLAYFA